MRTFLVSLLLAIGTTHLPAAEPADSIQPDPKSSTTESFTEHGVTLAVVCPKVVFSNYGNYILVSVRNDKEPSVTFMHHAPHELGIRFDIAKIDEKFVGFGTTICIPEFRFVTVGVDEGIKKDQVYKTLLYPTRYKYLEPGRYKMKAYWVGKRTGEELEIKLETKAIEFEYQGPGKVVQPAK